MEAVVAWATALPVMALDLWVTEGNAAAISLYQSCGFTFTGAAQAHPSQIGLRELQMRRPLAAR